VTNCLSALVLYRVGHERRSHRGRMEGYVKSGHEEGYLSYSACPQTVPLY